MPACGSWLILQHFHGFTDKGNWIVDDYHCFPLFDYEKVGRIFREKKFT